VSTPKEARAAGVCFYDLPEDLNYSCIDPLMRDLVKKINESGWCWSAESCQGHPDAPLPHAWAGNTDPMLRLVCEAKYAGEMMWRLVLAKRAAAKKASEHEMLGGIEPSLCLKLWDHYRGPKTDGWYELLVYIPSSTVWERNLGVSVYAEFAEAVNRGKP
jgi:hypothetical protein